MNDVEIAHAALSALEAASGRAAARGAKIGRGLEAAETLEWIGTMEADGGCTVEDVKAALEGTVLDAAADFTGTQEIMTDREGEKAMTEEPKSTMEDYTDLASRAMDVQGMLEAVAALLDFTALDIRGDVEMQERLQGAACTLRDAKARLHTDQ